jgi:phosphoglycolate phosphatase
MASTAPMARMNEIDRLPFKLLVFDWDGTLMDSIASIVACTQAAVRELGLGEVAAQTIRATVGLGLRETIDVLHPGCDDALFERIIDRYRHHWLSTYRDQPLLFEGVAQLLPRLAAEGYLLAVATGKSRRGLDYALEASGMTNLFHATRTADEALSKPHPKMLLDILDDLGVKPADAVMIGDTTYDLEMARNARTPALGVLSGSHSRRELESLAPLACLATVAEVPAWLAGRGVGVGGAVRS